VWAAQKSLSAAQQQYSQLVSGGTATPQNIGNFNTTAPEQVANAYNAAMAYALGSFAVAASQAQDATSYIASINPNAGGVQGQSQALASVLSPVASSASACASRSVIDPATGVCCDPDSCSWNVTDWYVKPAFVAQTDMVAMYTAQLVLVAQQALAIPVPPPPPTTTPPSYANLLPIRERTPSPTQTPKPTMRMPLNRWPLPRGVGSPAGLGDITQTPEYQAAVSQLTNQLTLEGQSSFDIQGSVQALGETFNQLNQQMGSPTDALQASLNYTLGSKSYGAAVDMVQGLVTSATSGMPPAELLQTFTGTMIGVMVLAGGISAGVGAAIVGAAAIVIGLLDQLGLFPGAPSGTALPGCPGVTYTGQGPSYQVPTPGYGGQNNVIYAWPDPYWDSSHKAGIQPGAPLWRKFPVQLSTGSPEAGVDFFWFQSPTAQSGGYPPEPLAGWPNLNWQPSNNNKPLVLFFCQPNMSLGNSFGGPGFRYIDAAFPLYHQMECETSIGEGMFMSIVGGQNVEVIQALVNFDVSFFAALQLNWEYALNGITPPASDLDVLIHTIYTWNRAHDPGKGWDIQPDTTSQPWFPNGTQCAGAPPWYAAILASNAGTSTRPPGVMSADGTKLHINTGAPKPFSLKHQGIHIVGSHFPIPRITPAGSSKPSNMLGNIAIGTATAVGVTAAGLAVYSYATKQKYMRVVGTLWDDTKAGARAGVRKVKGIFRR
jgi:hypothetical protein